jgi:hypothetical protein
MIKYRTIIEGDDEGFVLVEDGGVASWHFSSNGYILMEYCQDRITEHTTRDTMWDELADGKQYCEEFPLDVSTDVLVKDALSWLVFGADISDFELDESIFPNI